MSAPTKDNHDKPAGISRREALRHVTLMLGGVALTGCAGLEKADIAQKPEQRSAQALQSGFTQQQIALLDEVADTILPDTDTPGAKAAGVGPFIAVMVNDCYWPDDQAKFKLGLMRLEAECFNDHKKSFMDCSSEERLALLTRLDQEQLDFNHEMNLKNRDLAETEKVESKHYFRMIKELTLFGYFTSEIGMTQAQRYAETPGGYDPCAPYNGEPSWSSI